MVGFGGGESGGWFIVTEGRWEDVKDLYGRLEIRGMIVRTDSRILAAAFFSTLLEA